MVRGGRDARADFDRYCSGACAVSLGVRQQRFVLAVLALEVNQLVPTQRLIDLIWPLAAPASARGMIHTHVSGLRAIFRNSRAELHGVALLREPAGYVLRCDPSRIDAHEFQDLVSRARGLGGDEGQRVVLLDKALALWRGPALAGVAAPDTRDRLCRHLNEMRLIAAEDRIEAKLRLGHDHDVIDELLVLSHEHPDRQRLTGQLMLAMYRAGRPGESLRTYARARQRLADELGLEPGADLLLSVIRCEDVGRSASFGVIGCGRLLDGGCSCWCATTT